MPRFIWSFLLTATAAVALAEPAPEFLKCQAMLAKAAEKHAEKSHKQIERFEATVRKRVESLEASLPEGDPRIGTMQQVIDRLVAREGFADITFEYVDQPLQSIAAQDEVDETTTECPNKYDLGRKLASDRKWMGSDFDRIIDAVDERLALEDLAQNEGLAIIAFHSYGYVDGVYINRRDAFGGGIQFGPVQEGDYFRVVKVKEGSYTWERLWRNLFFGRSTFRIKKRDLTFTVEPGKLNYTGMFIYRPTGFSYAIMDIRDRTSAVLSMLEEQYPELLSEFELVNGLDHNEEFIDFYLREKDSSAGQAAAADIDET